MKPAHQDGLNQKRTYYMLLWTHNSSFCTTSASVNVCIPCAIASADKKSYRVAEENAPFSLLWNLTRAYWVLHTISNMLVGISVLKVEYPSQPTLVASRADTPVCSVTQSFDSITLRLLTECYQSASVCDNGTRLVLHNGSTQLLEALMWYPIPDSEETDCTVDDQSMKNDFLIMKHADNLGSWPFVFQRLSIACDSSSSSSTCPTGMRVIWERDRRAHENAAQDLMQQHRAEIQELQAEYVGELLRKSVFSRKTFLMCISQHSAAQDSKLLTKYSDLPMIGKLLSVAHDMAGYTLSAAQGLPCLTAFLAMLSSLEILKESRGLESVKGVCTGGVGGCGVGEYVALVIAGVLSLKHALVLASLHDHDTSNTSSAAESVQTTLDRLPLNQPRMIIVSGGSGHPYVSLQDIKKVLPSAVREKVSRKRLMHAMLSQGAGELFDITSLV